MSVVIARDRSSADHLIYKWPTPIPLGAQIECAANDTVVMCTHGTVGAQFGSGAHTLNPPPHTLAYFVKIVPVAIGFDRSISVTVATGHTITVRCFGAVTVRVSDPGMLCMQVGPLPTPNLAQGVARSVTRSVEKVVGRIVARRASAGDPMIVGALVDEASSHNPLGGAVSGLEFLGFQEMYVSIDDGEPLSWNVSTPVGVMSPVADPSGMSHPGMGAAQQGSAPSTGAFRTTVQGPASGVFDMNPPLAPADPSSPPRRKTPPLGTNMTRSDARTSASSSAVSGEVVTGEINASGIRRSHDSNPSLSPPPAPPTTGAHNALQVGSNPQIQPPPSPAAPAYRPLPMGASVLVAWHDGLWHSATVRQFRDGQYEVALGADGSVAWVAADQVRPG